MIKKSWRDLALAAILMAAVVPAKAGLVVVHPGDEDFNGELAAEGASIIHGKDVQLLAKKSAAERNLGAEPQGCHQSDVEYADLAQRYYEARLDERMKLRPKYEEERRRFNDCQMKAIKSAAATTEGDNAAMDRIKAEIDEAARLQTQCKKGDLRSCWIGLSRRGAGKN